jgi:DNA-binding CsgD family transcriptional regulator
VSDGGREAVRKASERVISASIDQPTASVAVLDRWTRRRDDGSAEALQERYALTPMQLSVALGLAEGLSYTEVAARHGVSRHTVHTHVKHLHKKLGIRSTRRIAAMLFEIEHE